MLTRNQAPGLDEARTAGEADANRLQLGVEDVVSDDNDLVCDWGAMRAIPGVGEPP